MASEIPAFLHFLLHWEIPEQLKHGRFGLASWQHPDLLAALDALAPETRLLTIIDEIFEFCLMSNPWQGTGKQLEKLLVESQFRHEAQKLLSWPTAAGTYLGRLEHSRPERVKSARNAKTRKWIIFPPPADSEVPAQAA